MPLGCPSTLVGRAAPSSAAAATSACPKLRAQRRQSVPGSACLAQTWFPFCRECRESSAEHSTREGVQLPLFLHQPSQRAPPPVRNMPRYPTGRHGGDLCLWDCCPSFSLGSGSAAAPVQPTQPAPRLASLPGVPDLTAAGKGALQCEPCQTLPVTASGKHSLRSQRLLGTTESKILGAAQASLTSELQCKDPDGFLPSTLVVTSNTV